MSSLRVSAHAHSRAIGQAAPGAEAASRAPSSADDTSFAGALGNAGAGRAAAADASPDDRPGGASPPRRGDRSQSKAAADGIAAAAALLLIPPLPGPPAAAPNSGGGPLAGEPALLTTAALDVTGSCPPSAATTLGISPAFPGTTSDRISPSAADFDPIATMPPQSLPQPDAAALPPEVAANAPAAAAQPNFAAPPVADMGGAAASPTSVVALPAAVQTVAARIQDRETPAGETSRMVADPASTQVGATAAVPGGATQVRLSPHLHPTSTFDFPTMALADVAPATANNAGDADAGAAGHGDGGSHLGQIVDSRRADDTAAIGAATSPDQPAAGPATGVDTAPPASPAASPAPALHDQIMGALVRLTASGAREMVVRLHPAELGDLTVRVALSGRDVTAWFMSPQPQVQHAIGEAMAQLQAGLGNAGYNLSDAWVGADAANARRHGAGGAPSAIAPAAPTAAAASAIAGARQSSAGMSIYV